MSEVWVIEQLKRGKWKPVRDVGLTKVDSERQIIQDWQFNFPLHKFRVVKYISVNSKQGDTMKEPETKISRSTSIKPHVYPSPKVRSVAMAMQAAEKKRKDLPMIVQVYPYDWDTVILTDHIKLLEAKLDIQMSEHLKMRTLLVRLKISAGQMLKDVKFINDMGAKHFARHIRGK